MIRARISCSLGIARLGNHTGSPDHIVETYSQFEYIIVILIIYVHRPSMLFFDLLIVLKDASSIGRHYGPFFLETYGPFFLETYGPFFLETYSAFFLVVLGPLEKRRYRFPEKRVHRFPEKRVHRFPEKRVHSAILRLSLTGLAE